MEMNTSPTIMAMANCSVHEQLFLVSTLSEFRKSGVEEALFADILTTHIGFCRIRGLQPPSPSTLSAVCRCLQSLQRLHVPVTAIGNPLRTAGEKMRTR